MVIHIHKNILSDGQSIHANVNYITSNETTNSFVIIGTQINPSRGQYLVLSHNAHDITSIRVVDENTIEVFSATIARSEIQHTLS